MFYSAGWKEILCTVNSNCCFKVGLQQWCVLLQDFHQCHLKKLIVEYSSTEEFSRVTESNDTMTRFLLLFFSFQKKTPNLFSKAPFILSFGLHCTSPWGWIPAWYHFKHFLAGVRCFSASWSSVLLEFLLLLQVPWLFFFSHPIYTLFFFQTFENVWCRFFHMGTLQSTKSVKVLESQYLWIKVC